MGALNLEYSESPKFKIVAKFLDGSKLPVSDIARIAGVSEKSVYRWAAGAGGPMYIQERNAKLAINGLNELSDEDKKLIANNLLPDDALDDVVTIVECPCDDPQNTQTQKIEHPEVKQLPAPVADGTDEMCKEMPDAKMAQIAKCFELMERHYQSRMKYLSPGEVSSALPDISMLCTVAASIAFRALYGIRALSHETEDTLVCLCNHFDRTRCVLSPIECIKSAGLSRSQTARVRAAFCFLKRRDPRWKYDKHNFSVMQDDLKSKRVPGPQPAAGAKTEPSCSMGPMLTLRAGGLELCIEQESLPGVIRALKAEGVI